MWVFVPRSECVWNRVQKWSQFLLSVTWKGCMMGCISQLSFIPHAVYMHALFFSFCFLSSHHKLDFLFLLCRTSVSCASNRKVLLEKYLTCRRRWSGRIKRLGYGLWASSLITFSIYFFQHQFSITFAWNCMPSFTFTSFHFLYTFLFTFLSHSTTWGATQALERQKEYTDAIRIERDELREEVVKLKDILKVPSQSVSADCSLLKKQEN